MFTKHKLVSKRDSLPTLHHGTKTAQRSKDIKIRAALARQKATELTNIWKDRNINKVLKVRVMKQMVWAVFLHGAEGWTIKKSDNQELRPWKCGVGKKC